jgi:dTDP-glucose pyrophosphorylase
MKNPELVILAAGMGSRYGGLKQIDKIDDYGHIIIDYSIYDAMKAGFRDITFIIKKEIEKDFREVMDSHLAGKDVNVKYVYQELSKIPEGCKVEEGREKPLGTGHAILCCKGEVDAPFVVINADDYYGLDTLKTAYDFLMNNDEPDCYAMVGFVLKNTLTENGSVSRGVSEAEDGFLSDIKEVKKIYKTADGAEYEDENGERKPIDENSIVSMNCWAFKESYLEKLEKAFPTFLENIPKGDLKKEFLIPEVVDDLIKDGKARVKVLTSSEKWFGVTYKEDKPEVAAKIKEMKDAGKYPEDFLK